MSGHSRWSKIHRQKSVADSKRGALFTKLGNAITIAAKAGGGDPTMNFKLQLAIDKAKTGNMPKDNIERAIKRGRGEVEGKKIEEITYEGFGPSGTAFIIEALTDNRNRTSAVMKHILSKYGGSLGGPGSVAWMFEPKGIIRTQDISEQLELELIDAGASDITEEEGGMTVQTAPADLKKVKDRLEQAGKSVDYAEIEHIAKDQKSVDDKTKEKLQKLFDELDNIQDVNNFYTNASL